MRSALIILLSLAALSGCTDEPAEPAEPLEEETVDEPVEVDLEALCPTDGDAVAFGAYYATPQDATGSAIWVYEETNGMPGLQRNDDTVPTECPEPDTIIV